MFTHNELVLIAAKWVKKSLKFPIVTTELKTTGSREIPDVLAFRSNTSLIIECKTSLIDFKRDFKKPERINQDKGVGNYRLYLAPEGLIPINLIPKSWGFLEVSSRGTINTVLFKQGNIYHNNSSPELYKIEDPFFHLSDIDKERSFLYSLLTRKNQQF